MALPPARRRVAGAGFTLIGVTVWVVSAVGPTAVHRRVAFLGVILGGMLAMVGLALNFAFRRRIRARYFQETEEDAAAQRRTRRLVADTPRISAWSWGQGSHLRPARATVNRAPRASQESNQSVDCAEALKRAALPASRRTFAVVVCPV